MVVRKYIDWFGFAVVAALCNYGEVIKVMSSLLKAICGVWQSVHLSKVTSVYGSEDNREWVYLGHS